MVLSCAGDVFSLTGPSQELKKKNVYTSPNAELSLSPVFLNFEIREPEGKNEFQICKICRDLALGLRSKLL